MGLFDQINTAESTFEAVSTEKHVPLIETEKLGEKKFRVKVSVLKHPNEMEHWIQWIELRVNNLFVGRAEFSAVIMDASAEFVVDCSGSCSITAIARCNKHGLWSATKG